MTPPRYVGLAAAPGPSAVRRGTGAIAPLFALLAFIAIAVQVPAQSYQLHEWSNFENGKIPAEFIPIGPEFTTRAQVIEYEALQGAPAGLYEPSAQRELGKYGLVLRSYTSPAHTVGDKPIGLTVGSRLNRAALGAEGRALFQADVFIPASAETMPSIAVLATKPLDGPTTSLRNYYRFGLRLGTMVYFSHIPDGGQAAVQFFKFSKEMLGQLPKDKWHRLAIVFRGSTEIRCYIDGVETPFSPLTEDSLTELQVGILLFDPNRRLECYVDNISVQFSMEDAPLPTSPWLGSWPARVQEKVLGPGGAAGGAPPASRTTAPPTQSATARPTTAAPATSAPATPADTAAGAGVTWYDTVEGWQRASSTGTPMLVAFMAPRVTICREFLQTMNSDPEARRFLSRHVPIYIDVNQLEGGDLAKKFGVGRVPALVLLDPTGAVKTRATVSPNDTWATVESRLRSGN